MPEKTLFLFDAHALCYRAFYAIRDLKTGKGQPTNAVFGFVNTLRKILSVYSPSYLAVCFDSKGKTFREERFAAYKIQRQPMPEDLITQIPIVKEVIVAFRLKIIERQGLEADDLIAAGVKWAKEHDIRAVIVSDDKDMFQLAGKGTLFYSPRNDALMGADELEKKLGFNPEYMADFLALAGDAADNIPGVKGIGKVTATKLIREFGALENILKRIDDVAPQKVREKIREQAASARLSRELAVLDGNLDINFDLDELAVKPPDSKRLFELFKELEFKRLAAEYGQEPVDESGNADFSVEEAGSAGAVKALAGEISRKKRFSFLWKSDESGDAPECLFLSVNKEKVYRVEPDAVSQLAAVFADEGVLAVTFNLKKSLKIFKRCGIFVTSQIFDCLLAGYLLGIPQSRLKLSDLAWDYLKVNITHTDAPAAETRAALDLEDKLQQQLKDHQLNSLLNDIELPLARVLFAMEDSGVALDVPLLSGLSAECDKKITALTFELFKLAGCEFNLNSPKQLGHILFEKLGLPTAKKTKTGFSTNEEVLTALAKSHDLPALILEYRQLAKMKSTYIDALPRMINSETNRIHAEFDQTGAETGRLSSRHPNLQNIPIRTELGRQIRKAIIAPEGNVLVAADYSQIELRILAHLSGDDNLIRAFKEGQDIHNYTASLIFDIDAGSVDYAMRDTAKRVNFGIIYGMSAFGLAKDLGISQPQAQEFIDRYFLRYPKVQNFMNACVSQCAEKGYVTTLLNRRRYIPDINSKNNAVRQYAQRQAINTPVQGSAADLMKMAMIKLSNELAGRRLKASMVLTVHDELVLEVPKREVKTVVTLIRDVMEHCLELVVPTVVTVKTGGNWLEMEEA